VTLLQISFQSRWKAVEATAATVTSPGIRYGGRLLTLALHGSDEEWVSTHYIQCVTG
jgi:hypothetical protein